MLCLCIAIEAHDEVVANIVSRADALETLCRFGEVEDAPVCYAADYAAALKDQLAS
jgi:hypothetical protein